MQRSRSSPNVSFCAYHGGPHTTYIIALAVNYCDSSWFRTRAVVAAPLASSRLSTQVATAYNFILLHEARDTIEVLEKMRSANNVTLIDQTASWRAFWFSINKLIVIGIYSKHVFHQVTNNKTPVFLSAGGTAQTTWDMLRQNLIHKFARQAFHFAKVCSICINAFMVSCAIHFCT